MDKIRPSPSSTRTVLPTVLLQHVLLLRAGSRSPAWASEKGGDNAGGRVIQTGLVTDEQLRDVLFGDLPQHGMARYQGELRCSP